MAGTGADLLRAAALHEVGEPYVWGKEGTGGVDGNDAYDCSGFAHAIWEAAGYKIARMTANDYYRKATKIAASALQPGDPFFMLDSTGHATHVGLCIGNSETVEARGRVYGVVHYKLTDPKNGAPLRGAVFGHMLGMNLGPLTGMPVTPPPVVKPPTVMPQVWKGSKGSTVRVLQAALIRRGFSCGKWGADGDFGAATKSAVVAFQRKTWRWKPWRWDGICGPLTWAALGY